MVLRSVGLAVCFSVIAGCSTNGQYRGNSDIKFSNSVSSDSPSLASCEVIDKTSIYNIQFVKFFKDREEYSRPSDFDRVQKIQSIARKLESLGWRDETGTFDKFKDSFEKFGGKLRDDNFYVSTNLVNIYEDISQISSVENLSSISSITGEEEKYSPQSEVYGSLRWSVLPDVEKRIQGFIQANYIQYNPGNAEARCSTHYANITSSTLANVIKPLKCESTNESLVSAILRKDYDCTKQLLSNPEGIDINKPLSGQFKYTPLYAATCGNFPGERLGFESLIEPDEEQETLGLISTLMSFGADLSIKTIYDSRRTIDPKFKSTSAEEFWPLKCSFDRDFKKMAGVLLEAENIVDQVDETDDAFVAFAKASLIQAGKSQLVSRLEFDPNSCEDPSGPMGNTHLAHAVMWGEIDKVNELLEAGADPNYTEADCAFPAIFHVTSQILAPYPPFMSMSGSERGPIVLEILLENGVDLNVKDPFGRTVEEGMADLRLKLKKGFDNGDLDKAGYDGRVDLLDRIEEIIDEYN